MRRLAALLPLLAYGCAVPASGPAANIELTSFSLSAESINVEVSSAKSTCQMGIQETGTNTILNATCAFRSPSGSIVACVSGVPATGTTKNGTWECELTFPHNAEDGEWLFAYIQVNNSEAPPKAAYVSKTDLNTNEPTWPDRIEVVSSAADSTRPTVSAFNRAPATILSGDLPQTLSCAVTATDNVAVFGAGCTWRPPNGETEKQVSCSATSEVDDVWSCSASVPAYDAGPPIFDPEGQWDIVTIYAVDEVGNLQSLGVTQVTALPGPTTFDVDPGSTPVCGNNITEGTEECDGTDDAACPGLCQVDCACGAGACAPGATELTATTTGASGVWDNSTAQQAASDSLTFSAYIRTDTSQAILTLGDQSMSAFDQAAVLVRLNFDGTTNFVDVRNGGSYANDAAFAWVADTWYKVTVTANVTAETYTVQIGECDQSQTTVATNYAFRNQGSNGSLTHYALWKSGSDTVSFTGTADLAGANWSEVCTPLTCSAYDPYSCGTPADGCGSTIDCDTPAGGDCENRSSGGWTGQAGDTCYQDQCCRPTTCIAEGYECGTPPDGCGGTLSSCGSCTGEEVCLNDYTCGAASAFPTTSNTGITDYWCPRWDSLKTTSASSTYTVATDDVVEYVHLSDGGFDLTGSKQTIRCSRATSDTQKKFEMTGPYVYGALMENVHADAVITSTGGRSWYGGGSSFTVSRSQSYPTYADVMQTESGFWIDNYLDTRVNAAGPTSIHTDVVQVSGGCGPHWYVHNTMVGDSGRNGIPEPSPRDCSTLSYWAPNGYCSNAVLFVKGKWSNQPCRRIQSMVIADNYIDGGLYPSRWSDSSGRIINSAYWNNTWSPLWYYGPCYHNWLGSGNDGTYSRVTDPDPSPTSSQICIEDDDKNNIDGDIAEANTKCDFAPGESFAKGSCTGGTNTTGIEPIPTMTLPTPSLSATSCSEGTAACNDIDIIVGTTTTNEGARAQATGDSDPDAGDLWDTSSPGPSFRWRYNCGGSSTNTMDDGTQSLPPCSRTPDDHCVGGYQDNKADLWYDYPPCDGLTSCTLTDVCDFQAETAGTFTVKVYVEAGPGAAYRPSDHEEITFTVQ